jgi:hypothetical protein
MDQIYKTKIKIQVFTKDITETDFVSTIIQKIFIISYTIETPFFVAWKEDITIPLLLSIPFIIQT